MLVYCRRIGQRRGAGPSAGPRSNPLQRWRRASGKAECATKPSHINPPLSLRERRSLSTYTFLPIGMYGLLNVVRPAPKPAGESPA